VLAWFLTLGRERRFRERLVDLVGLGDGESALDVGCGTGNLALAAKARVGASGRVCGVDPSPEMIARARRKAARAGVDVRFENAAAEALPFPDETFDAVLSTLMLHHLTEEGRREGVAEIARVMRPGGKFLAVDMGEGKGRHGGFHLRLARRHAHVEPDALAPLLDANALRIVDDGRVGFRGLLGLPNLWFVRSVKPAP
jgi:ubiquinone/menaquinone biosynthesis C-methylase UbiE